ncbi:STAS domain-containing protein [Larkinella arboricola]|uniref:STAS domain-containing protein n=1 Tax=Larkinella arboricola TaxID=643671 RepID=A0A327WK53_LARAB|nr:STAS domain-containing protein [Larkinella arboricola]RAJ92163.1 STAS domain-containing protein [Larkinella arboricola]
MNYAIEKNEQYSLITLNETVFGGEVPSTFETLSRNLFREGYSNIIVDFSAVDEIEDAGIPIIRKINRQCTNESGLFILVTKRDDVIDYLDDAKIADLTILPTVEEAVDAVFMNELENDFRSEDDDSYEYGGSSDD